MWNNCCSIIPLKEKKDPSVSWQRILTATIFSCYLSKYAWQNLTSGKVSTYTSNESKHSKASVKKFCLMCKSEFHFLFSCVLLIMMTRLPSWVNCNSSSGCHSSSSYKSSSFWTSRQRASGSGILSSEDSKEQFTSNQVRKQPTNNTHHRPASVVHLSILLRWEQTLTIVVLYYDLRFFCKDVLLSVLVRGGSHGCYVKKYYKSI